MLLTPLSTGDLGTFWLISPNLWGKKLPICRISSSKVVVGNGGLNSKSVVSALFGFLMTLNVFSVNYALAQTLPTLPTHTHTQFRLFRFVFPT